MAKMALVTSVLCLVLAIVVFVFADGLRRWYSGIFFAVMGAVLLLSALRWRRADNQ
jgi:hypothetical protein